KEHPTLFQAPMVRATLEGRKTQTRRPVTRRNSVIGTEGVAWADLDFDRAWPDNMGESHYLKVAHRGDAEGFMDGTVHRVYPRCRPGDRLWVRETWAIDGCGGRVKMDRDTWPDGWPTDRLQYPATDEAPNYSAHKGPYWWNKRPSIHMPRWASRITLKVVRVWPQRVQDITVDEVVAEGLWQFYAPEVRQDLPRDDALENSHPARTRIWKSFWDGLYARRPDLQWAANPWVWVIEFKKVTP
ncbi:MAG: hypothetical protein KKC37_04905, partial [Proteobacteria bacterium]|nr:hypothetical protein [Pseudomonadota bacterium]